jgi:hypothetical protein
VSREVLDIERWKGVFPLRELRDEARASVLKTREEQPEAFPNDEAVEEWIRVRSPGGAIITGPADIAVVEQLRGEVPELADHEGLATDVFVWGLGEGPSREATRVGGTPYRPRGLEWPVGPTGTPMAFVAQICFADSRDLLEEQFMGNLPGDVLLLFLPEDYWDEDELPFHTEWYDLGLKDLVSPEDVPEPPFPLQPCYGVRHRTADYPSALNLFEERYNQPWSVAILEGTKIGGAAWWIQGEEELEGEYLLTLGSLGVSAFQPWPWLNQEAPFDSWTGPEDLMQWGDAGTVYFSLDEDGELHWVEQGY